MLAINRILTICTVQIFLLDALPWQGHRSNSIPTSYRLDAWSQYDNPEEGTEREGDIHETELSRKTTTRDRNLLWTGRVVRYYVDQLIVDEPAKLAVLDDAISAIEENTCLKFVRIFPKNGEFPRSSWINITGHERGCFSDLGRSPVGPSVLNLDVKRCFRTRGHSLHEILHALGVYHEHMRPDRDQFINILWENIKEGEAFNFRVLDDKAVTNYGLPYDYDSVMHYSMTAFSKDKGIPTVVPMKEDVDIGQRNHLSTYDVQKLLITYECENLGKVMAHPEERDHLHSDKLEILNLNASARVSDKDIHTGEHGHRTEIPGVGERVFNLQRPRPQLRPLPEPRRRPRVLTQITASCLCPCNTFFYYYYSNPEPRFSEYYV